MELPLQLQHILCPWLRPGDLSAAFLWMTPPPLLFVMFDGQEEGVGFVNIVKAAGSRLLFPEQEEVVHKCMGAVGSHAVHAILPIHHGHCCLFPDYQPGSNSMSRVEAFFHMAKS